MTPRASVARRIDHVEERSDDARDPTAGNSGVKLLPLCLVCCGVADCRVLGDKSQKRSQEAGPPERQKCSRGDCPQYAEADKCGDSSLAQYAGFRILPCNCEVSSCPPNASEAKSEAKDVE